MLTYMINTTQQQNAVVFAEMAASARTRESND